MLRARSIWESRNLRPIRRLTAKTVFCGLVIAWRLAICPTRRSPSSEKATMEAVVRLPSRLGSTTGTVASTIAAQLFVVPRSMPRILLIADGSSQTLKAIVRRRQAPESFSEGGAFLAVICRRRRGLLLDRHRHLHHRGA